MSPQLTLCLSHIYEPVLGYVSFLNMDMYAFSDLVKQVLQLYAFASHRSFTDTRVMQRNVQESKVAALSVP
jgi:hypothetical protein